MLIGFDLDNTLFDYSESVQIAGAERLGISQNSTFTKESLKAQVQEIFGDHEWTRLQGLLYTSYIKFAKIDSHAIGLLNYLSQRSYHTVKIVSHKTHFPILGPRLNMREMAERHFEYLTMQHLGFRLNIAIHFTETLEEKINYINDNKFDIFVDDLMEVIARLNLKNRILFSSSHLNSEKLIVSDSWKEISAIMKEQLGC